MSFVCLDVDYRADRVVTAAVGFTAWPDEHAAFELVLTSREPPAAYEPGSFARRELPYLLEILDALVVPLTAASTIVIDGFTWLDGGRPGLGAQLHEQHPARPIVVGVAKRPWRGGAVGVPVLRGTSGVALHVTAAGMSEAAAARGVVAMHGPHRTPTLLKRVDRLARDA